MKASARPLQGPAALLSRETDNAIHNLQLKEADMVKILAKLPENSQMYKAKKQKLDSIVRERSEIEKMLYSKADQTLYLHEKVVDD